MKSRYTFMHPRKCRCFIWLLNPNLCFWGSNIFRAANVLSCWSRWSREWALLWLDLSALAKRLWCCSWDGWEILFLTMLKTIIENAIFLLHEHNSVDNCSRATWFFQALESMGATVRHDMFNPKSMPRQQLLGHIDMDTRQWTDGLLTHVAQSVYNEPSGEL